MKEKKNKTIQYIDKFLAKYGQIQLWSFVIIMVMVAILYIINPAAYTYQVVPPDQEELQLFIEGINITLEKYLSSKVIEYETISNARAEEMQKETNKLTIIATICIFGMVFSQKEKRERLKQIYKKLKERIQ